MIKRILRQGPAYYSAIRNSAETAQQGCIFAKDAIAFCESLVKPNDSLQLLQSGLERIKDVAEKAHQGAKDVYEKFRLVRVELNEARFHLFYARSRH